MKSTSKTPYEIRLELLQLAFGILSQQHAAAAITVGKSSPLTSPKTEEVIAEAEKMNSFISKANGPTYSIS